jgi:hypothetical protein
MTAVSFALPFFLGCGGALADAFTPEAVRVLPRQAERAADTERGMCTPVTIMNMVADFPALEVIFREFEDLTLVSDWVGRLT